MCVAQQLTHASVGRAPVKIPERPTTAPQKTPGQHPKKSITTHHNCLRSPLKPGGTKLWSISTILSLKQSFRLNLNSILISHQNYQCTVAQQDSAGHLSQRNAITGNSLTTQITNTFLPSSMTARKPIPLPTDAVLSNWRFSPGFSSIFPKLKGLRACCFNFPWTLR